MAVEAAVAGDIELLKLAVLHDPLVGAVCTPDEVWAMVDEMVIAQAEWLPQYAEAVPAARERVVASKVATRDWRGTARREARSVEELRQKAGAHG
jgi:alpha-galactosidase